MKELKVAIEQNESSSCDTDWTSNRTTSKIYAFPARENVRSCTVHKMSVTSREFGSRFWFLPDDQLNERDITDAPSRCWGDGRSQSTKRSITTMNSKSTNYVRIGLPMTLSCINVTSQELGHRFTSLRWRVLAHRSFDGSGMRWW